MEISTNFDFLKQEFPFATESAGFAEYHVYGDPRAACFHARHCLERLVKRVYKVDKTLKPPHKQNLDSYMTDPAFRELIPEVVWQKAEYVRKAGNVAVHGNKAPTPEKALDVIRELSHVMYWAGRTYLRRGAEKLQGFEYDESLIPKQETGASPESLEHLESRKQFADKAEDEAMARLEAELQKVRDELAAIKAENDKVPETHDWNEDKTRKLIVDLGLKRAGWPLDQKRDREYEVTGMPNNKGIGYIDYVLWGDDGKPLAVVEAKRTMVDAKQGQQQAKLYADCLEAMTGQRPLIFYTNGYDTYLWDDCMYPERKVAGFYKKDELQALIIRRDQRQPLDVALINNDIAGRVYQKRAIGSIGQQFADARRKALLVMATGTGKTRTAIALVDWLQRAGWIKRALFLADRRSLVHQAVGAFKTQLPESSPVNLVTEKEGTGRVYVSTYPSMMGLINATRNNEARFSIGHFDLVIIDEAHRSVYQKYGAIFEYFDSLLVGLTATPREQVDKNTYDLFDLESGSPTDAYELETAVKDGFLVPPKARQVNLKFPQRGIKYDELPDDEKAQWESLDWGDEGDGTPPDEVNASAVNNWLFNTDTVDKVLKHLMENGHKVEGGDRLAKTIIFARNHDHAVFIEQRFNTHYPNFKGHFARVIDNKAKYVQSLIDDFSQKDKVPHIAISVDMLDTGIDVPEVANLVFFKPVYSKIKFWQMIGRGTRLCPDLFGPGDDKQDFRIFDFCFNFDFFRENPEGIKGGGGLPLASRLFRSRVGLISLLQEKPELDAENLLRYSVTQELQGEVGGMNRENFIVAMKREAVDRFRDPKAWNQLDQDDVATLQGDVAGLPSEVETDDIESRMFDLTALKMQLALATGDASPYESARKRVVKIALLLTEKESIPAVKAQLAYLTSMQETEFWEGMTLQLLEDMRLRLRSLVPFLDRKSRTIVYTKFEDEIVGVHDQAVIDMPRMTSREYENKVKTFLQGHPDHLAIRKLRSNQPLTETDLEGLESALTAIGADDGQTLLSDLLARSEAPSLAWFVRSLVGLDREAANAAFGQFLNDRSLTSPQIRFIEMIIDQLTSRGVMEASALYETPFTTIHAGGPDALFGNKENVIEAVFSTLKQFDVLLKSEAG